MDIMNKVYNALSSPKIDLRLQGEVLKKSSLTRYNLEFEDEDPIFETEISYLDKDVIKGEIVVTPEFDTTLSYFSIEIHLVGFLQSLDFSRKFYDSFEVLEGENEISSFKKFPFKFEPSPKPYESFYGRLFEIRYCLQVIILRGKLERQIEEFFDIFIFKDSKALEEKESTISRGNFTKGKEGRSIGGLNMEKFLNFEKKIFDSFSLDDEDINTMKIELSEEKEEEEEEEREREENEYKRIKEQENINELEAKFFANPNRRFILKPFPFQCHVPFLPSSHLSSHSSSSISFISKEKEKEKEIKKDLKTFSLKNPFSYIDEMILDNQLSLTITLSKKNYQIGETIFGSLFFKEVSIPFEKVEVSIARKEFLGRTKQIISSVLTRREVLVGLPFPGDLVRFRIDTRPISKLLSNSYDIMKGEASVFYSLQVFLCDRSMRKLFKEHFVEFFDGGKVLECLDGGVKFWKNRIGPVSDGKL